MIIGLYGIGLAAALCAGCLVFERMRGASRIAYGTTPLLAVTAAVLGALCARLYRHAAGSLVFGMGFEGYAPLSLYPYEYAACGAILGVLLAAWLTALITRQSALRLLDALAPAGLIALAIARFSEHFSDFGWGQVFENARWQRFPFAVQDMYGQWHIAVYVLEGVLALAVCLLALRVRRRMPGDRFLTALLWWSITQIFCESLRAETLRWGFVRVQQLQCAVLVLAALIGFMLKARWRGEALRALDALRAYAIGIGVTVLMEYALDKWTLSLPVCYGIMAAALVYMGVRVQRIRPKLLPED